MLVSEVRRHLCQHFGRTELLFFRDENESLGVAYMRKRKDCEHPSFPLGYKSSPNMCSLHFQCGGGEALPVTLVQQSTIRLEKYIEIA